MQDNPATVRVSIQEVNVRADTAQHVVIGFSRAMPNLADLWQQIIHSLSDIPIVITEITRLQAELIRARLDRANLAAAAKATIAAFGDEDRDAFSYLHDELEAQGFTGDRRQV